ncbi:hypothetical protein [Fodinicola acaciae]|uniref:aldose epimerase family protein n=1 Tax=Fodinicola acaciae TaxID=2681555 RepID=UPI0013D12589|nr:hypothetical protein [Fodinicola acaciae]
MEIRGADCRARFVPADGARLAELSLGGHQLMVSDWGGGELFHGAFVMAPWTSTLPDATFTFAGDQVRMPADYPPNAEHGVVRKSGWRPSAGGLATDIAGGWPYGGTVTMTPTPLAGGLDLSLTVRAGTRPMPAAVGWHPWFVRHLRGREAQVRIPAGALEQERDDSGRPTGRWLTASPPPWNACLRTAGPVEVEWPGVGTLTIAYSSAYVTLFTSHERGVCVEPVTSPAETMDRVLLPGEDLRLDISLRWTAA